MKKLICCLLSMILSISSVSSPVYAKELETHKDVVNVGNDSYIVEVKSYFSNDSEEKIVTVENGESIIVYDTGTGKMYNAQTGKLMAEVFDEEILEDNDQNLQPFQLMRAANSFTIASRWTYSYTSQQLTSAYNPSVSDMISILLAIVRSKGAKEVAGSILETISLSLLQYAIDTHGSTNVVKHYKQVKHYANRYVMSDFACVYSEANEAGTFVGNIGYDLRITTNAG